MGFGLLFVLVVLQDIAELIQHVREGGYTGEVEMHMHDKVDVQYLRNSGREYLYQNLAAAFSAAVYPSLC
jgi:hypothetical protein